MFGENFFMYVEQVDPFFIFEFVLKVFFWVNEIKNFFTSLTLNNYLKKLFFYNIKIVYFQNLIVVN